MQIWYKILLFLFYDFISTSKCLSDDLYKFYICHNSKISKVVVSKLFLAPKCDLRKGSGDVDKYQIIFKLGFEPKKEVPVDLEIDILEINILDKLKEELSVNNNDIGSYYYLVDIKNLKFKKEIVYLKFLNEEGDTIFYLRINCADLKISLKDPIFKTGSLLNKKNDTVLKHNESNMIVNGEERRIFLVDQEAEKINVLVNSLKHYENDFCLTKCYCEIKSMFVELFSKFNELLDSHKNLIEKHPKCFDRWINSFKNLVLCFAVGIVEVRYSFVVEENSCDDIIYYNGSGLLKYLEIIYNILIKELKVQEKDIRHFKEYKDFKTSYQKLIGKLETKTKEIDHKISEMCNIKYYLLS